jgi:hypothetical protein
MWQKHLTAEIAQHVHRERREEQITERARLFSANFAAVLGDLCGYMVRVSRKTKLPIKPTANVTQLPMSTHQVQGTRVPSHK